MAKEIFNPIALLEQIPDVTADVSGTLNKDPNTHTIFTIWSQNREGYSVPMIGVLVGDKIVNLDRRTGLGKEIFQNFEKRWER